MKYIVLLMMSLALIACGGSNSDSRNSATSENEAKGIYTGLTDSGKELTAIIRNDGEFYIFIQESDGRRDDLSGLISGTATAAEGNFVSDNALARNFDGGESRAYNVTASYVAADYLTGIITDVSSGRGIGFTVSSRTDNDSDPDLEKLSGEYFSGLYKGVSDTTVESIYVAVQVEVDGSLSGSRVFSRMLSSGFCSFSGTLSPRSGSHLFNVAVSFPDNECLLSAEELQGIAYYDEDVNQLFVAVFNADRSSGLFFSGLKGY